MFGEVSRRLFLLQLLLIAGGCSSTSSLGGSLIVGVISYGEGEQAIERFSRFNRYLGKQAKMRIELEPAFSENIALERIKARRWSLVFAPPGIAAIAISRYQYLPLFPLQGVSNLRSILVVSSNSSIQNMKQLAGQTVALGQLGSATGYYFPLYNLYGLTLAQVLFAPTPSAVLELVEQGKATAGAISQADFSSIQLQPKRGKFRILFTDSHSVPPGVVLVGPDVDRNRQEQIRRVMSAAPPDVVQAAGYIPNVPVPDYQYMIAVVERVRAIAAQLQQQPVRLF